MDRLRLLFCLAALFLKAPVLAQTISSFAPASGNIGTLVTLSGTGLERVTDVSVSGAPCLILDKSETTVRFMVMPGAVTGSVGIKAGATINTSQHFTVTAVPLNTALQGAKLVDTTGPAVSQGSSIALSADGNTLAIGTPNDSGSYGSVIIYTRNGTEWRKQARLRGTGASGRSRQGTSVALSADGNTLASGGWRDSFSVGGRIIGATWIFTRKDSIWTQQGPKIVGQSDQYRFARQGASVALSADGNTLAVGGRCDTMGMGATWVFKRSGGTWNQQGDCLIGTGREIKGNYSSSEEYRSSVALSANGNTLAVGVLTDNRAMGAVWIFNRTDGTWMQEGTKLVGVPIGRIGGYRGNAVSLSADGKTLAVGAASISQIDTIDYTNSNYTDWGVTWIYIHTDSGWAQQGDWLIGTGPYRAGGQGSAVALSADGNTLATTATGTEFMYGSIEGVTWVFNRTGDTWTQHGWAFRAPGTVGYAAVGSAAAMSADGRTLAIGGPKDNTSKGATWVFSRASNDVIIPSAPEPEFPAFFWPNPSTGSVTISGGPATGNFRMIDGAGRILLNSGYHSGQPIDISVLSTSIYWIQINGQKAIPFLKL